MKVIQQLTPYAKYLPTGALFFGLIFDIFTLDRPDAIFENVVIAGYLILSAIVMLLLQARVEGSNEHRRLILLGVLQFSFGNLASALMVLYARSGTLAGSAIFIGVLATLFLGNELLRNRYARTHLRVVIWFILLLTYSSIFVPVLLNSIGVFTFFASMAIALGITSTLVFLLSRVAHSSFKRRSRRISISVVLISLIFSGLYFSNLIPPVPLALKEIGIYHSINRSSGTYTVTYEPTPWFIFWRNTNKTYHQTAGYPVYCFSSVFAPKDLETEIRHKWEKYSPDQEKWQTVARIPFPITGGRIDGFRGYTQTMQISEGTWRCSVETSRGNLIGRESFIVKPATEPTDLQTTQF